MIQGGVRLAPQSVAFPGGSRSSRRAPGGAVCPVGVRLGAGGSVVGARGPAGVSPRCLERPKCMDATGASVACGETPTCPRARPVGGFPAAVAGVFTGPWRPDPCGPLRMTRSRPRPCAYTRRASPRGGRAPGFFPLPPPARTRRTDGRGCAGGHSPQATVTWLRPDMTAAPGAEEMAPCAPPPHNEANAYPREARARPPQTRGFAAISGPATAAPKYSHPPETPDPPAPRPRPPERSARDRPQAHAHHGERGGHAPDPSAPRRTRTP
ncbi:hypothetical protein SRIMM317S_05225 [Streptomyces rimosus subsp. rimosus]